MVAYHLMTCQHFRNFNDGTCGFVRDGTPPYFLRVVGQRLNHAVGRQWNDLVSWPARSTDRNPL